MRTIKGEITRFVRQLGGDEMSGAQYLCPKLKLTIGGHKHALRVPVGSLAAKKSISELTDLFEAFIHDGSDLELVYQLTPRTPFQFEAMSTG